MPEISVVLLYGLTALVGAISFDNLLHWLYQKSRQIYASLDLPKSPTYYTKSALIYVAVILIESTKGYGMVWLCDWLFYSESMNIMTILILITAHALGPFNRFKVNRYFGLVLWGIYAFIDPSLGTVYPIGFLLLAGLTNSLYYGFLSNIVLMFFLMWSFDIDPVYLPVNFIMFAVALLASRNQLFHHLDKKGETLLESFQNRS